MPCLLTYNCLRSLRAAMAVSGPNLEEAMEEVCSDSNPVETQAKTSRSIILMKLSIEDLCVQPLHNFSRGECGSAES